MSLTLFGITFLDYITPFNILKFWSAIFPFKMYNNISLYSINP